MTSDARERRARTSPPPDHSAPLCAVRHCAAPDREHGPWGRVTAARAVSAADLGRGAGHSVKERGPKHSAWDSPVTLVHLQNSLNEKALRTSHASSGNTPRTPKSLLVRQAIGQARGRERLATGEDGSASRWFPPWPYSVFRVGIFNRIRLTLEQFPAAPKRSSRSRQGRPQSAHTAHATQSQSWEPSVQMARLDPRWGSPDAEG